MKMIEWILLGIGILALISLMIFFRLFTEVLFLLLVIETFLLIMLALRTPALKFLKAWWKRLPIVLDVERKDFRIPREVKDQIAIFPDKKYDRIVPCVDDFVINTKYGQYGLYYPSNSAIVHPRTPEFALALKESGFNDLTEAQMAVALHHIEKEYGEIDINGRYKVTMPDGRTKVVSGLEFLKEELKELGVYPLAITAREIKNVLNNGKHKNITEQDINVLTNMQHFLGLELRPAAIRSWVHGRVAAAREESLLGNVKDTMVKLAWIGTALIGLGLLIYFLSESGGIEGLLGKDLTQQLIGHDNIQMALILLWPKKYQ